MSEHEEQGIPSHLSLVGSVVHGSHHASDERLLNALAHRLVESVANKLVATVEARLEECFGAGGVGAERVAELTMARARRALVHAGEPAPRLLTKAELARALNTSPAQIDRLRRIHPDFPCESIGAQSPRFDLQACRLFLRQRASMQQVGGTSGMTGVERLRRRA